MLSIGRHEQLGWLALAAATLHVAAAVAADRTVVEYLRPTLPIYQILGVAALALAIGMVATSLIRIRRRLWRSHRNFQATHIALGCFLTACLAAHVIVTSRYADGIVRRLVYTAAAAGGIAMLLRYRRHPDPERNLTTHRMVFGRHSALVAACIVVTGLALATLGWSRARLALRESVLARAQGLPLDFDHSKHVSVNCLTCHHNYADGRGADGCIHCHRAGGPPFVAGVEARFHDFCLGCHRNPPQSAAPHGPVSGCSNCHRIGAATPLR